jgi:GIY-YIG catalytic domain
MDNTNNKYQNGKVYSLSSVNRDKVYIGSTTSTLNQRLAKHKCDYKRWLDGKKTNSISSFEIIECGNYIIDLLENYPCLTKQELCSKEQEWIEKTANCVNTCKAYTGLSKKEYIKEYSKEYKKTEKSKKYQKEYKKTEEYKEYRKKYKKTEKSKEYHKNWHKQRIATKINCECGGKTDLANKPRHEKSIQHQAYLNQQQQ